LNWHLDVYGRGIKEDDYINLVSKYKLESKITFKGTVNNSSLIASIPKYDLLVLPSRFDGWGAVVNEAIASGVKVICSDRCGAAILLVDPAIGSVFDINKTKELVALLESSIDSDGNYDRTTILDFSQYLSGKKVADYLIEILEFHYYKIGERPLPPWEKYLRDQRNKQSSF
jgi:glycosyltransferase involved in cell wall biosynthesis